MGMGKVLCSTGALLGMPNGRNWRLLKDCAKYLNCDGYELMFYDTWYPERDAIIQYLENLGLPIDSWHCEKNVGALLGEGQEEAAFAQFALNCQMARAVGAKKMVLHLWNAPVSDAHIERNLAAYAALRDRAAQDQITLTVENVVCSHADPLTHWQNLVHAWPDAALTLDTKMAAFHGQLGALCSEACRPLWDRNIRHIHLNDYGGGYRDWQNLRTLHPGRGNIDFDAFFSFLKTTNYAGDFTIEATSFLPDGVIHWEDLNRTFAWLRERLKNLQQAGD